MRKGIHPPHSLAQISGARLELVNLINFTTWLNIIVECMECLGGEEGHLPPPPHHISLVGTLFGYD